MKYLLILGFTSVLFCCQLKIYNSSIELQDQIDTLKSKFSKSYIPGFGEFMSNIQTHHSKLWFAGKDKNWKLADFEIDEIEENLESIQKYETAREESKLISMIAPALDSVYTSVQRKNSQQFEKHYRTLTNTCNSCHRLTKYEFIQITVPSGKDIFNNQKFKVEK